MTELWWPKLGLEHDRKIFRTTNLNNWIWPKFTTTTNINYTPKKYAGAVGLWLQAPTGHCSGRRIRIEDLFSQQNRHLQSLGSPVTSLLFKKETSGTKVRRTSDVRLRFVSFNFAHVQLLRFVIFMVRSYSFGHLDCLRVYLLF